MLRWLILSTVMLNAGISFGFAQQTETLSSSWKAAADTTGRELQEIVVEGRTQRIIEGGVEYIPDKKTKKFATDAISLLSNMMIPQLNITSANAVKTRTGSTVKIFIDYVEATDADTQGLRPEDVLRVEVLDYPVDPRFRQEEHVVNFIMRKYEWGGYTKLMSSGRLLFNDKIWGGLYQKFSYKNWLFDLNASGDGTWANDNEEYSKETFRDFDFKGNHYAEASRISSTDRYRTRDNNQNASLRVSYGNDRMYLGHTVSFSRYGMPSSDKYSHVEYDGLPIATDIALESKKSQSTHSWITGNYWFALPDDNNLQADWTMGFAGMRERRSYYMGNLDPMLNDNHLKFYYPHLSVTHSKNFGHGNTIGARIYSSYYIHDTRYNTYTESRIRSVNSDTRLTVNYYHRWNFGLALNARLGAQYIYGRRSGVDYAHNWSPYGTASLNYNPNSKNTFGITVAWFDYQVFPDETDNVILREDELLWYKGNPELRNPENKQLTFNYSFMPNNTFSLYSWISYNNVRHNAAYDYTVVNGFDGIVRTYSDVDTEHNIDGAVSLTLRLLDRSLSVSGTAGISRDIISGIHPLNNTDFHGSLSISWTFRNFYLHAFYDTPRTSVFGQRGYKIRNPQEYGIRASYAVGNFKSQIIFANWFSNGKTRHYYDSGHYDFSGWNSKMPTTRFISLTVQYTIPYGKPVNRNDEIQSSISGGAGFLK